MQVIGEQHRPMRRQIDHGFQIDHPIKEDGELANSCVPTMRGFPRNAMLVLSRKVGERILIGDRVTVTVVRITGGGVRLGIEAARGNGGDPRRTAVETDKSAEATVTPRKCSPSNHSAKLI